MKKILLAAFIGALALLAPRPAAAITCPVVHTFVTGETLVAVNLNSNPSQWANCFQNIDYRNIGAAGLQAAQVIPQSIAQATFGGAFGYTFYPNSTTQVPLTISGTTGQAVDIFDVTLTSGGGLAFYVASDGSTHMAAAFANALSVTSIVDTGLITATSLIATSNSQGTAAGPAYAGNSAGAFINLPTGGGSLYVGNFNAGVNYANIGPGGVVSSNGMTVGGALTGATTMTSSGNHTSTAGQYHAGASTINATSGTEAYWGADTNGTMNFLSSNSQFLFRSAGGVNLFAVSNTGLGTFFGGVAAGGPLTATTVNASGLGTFVGLTAGTGTVRGASDGATVAYTPPVYDASGATLASTTHIAAKFNIAVASNQTCSAFSLCPTNTTVALSGAGAFSSSDCFLTSASGGFTGTQLPKLIPEIVSAGVITNSVTVGFYNASNAAVLTDTTGTNPSRAVMVCLGY